MARQLRRVDEPPSMAVLKPGCCGQMPMNQVDVSITRGRDGPAPVRAAR